jgi:hypothetical protein
MMTYDVSMIQTFNVSRTIFSKLDELVEVYKKLGYKDDRAFRIAEDILAECFRQGKGDVIISRTGENELLIYRKMDGEYRNIIVDEDGDIEHLHIPVERSQTYNQFVEFIMVDAGKIKELVNKL